MRSTISTSVLSGAGARFMIRSWRTRSSGSEAIRGLSRPGVDLATSDSAVQEDLHGGWLAGELSFPHARCGHPGLVGLLEIKPTTAGG